MDDIRIPLLSKGQTGLAHILPLVKPWYTCGPAASSLRLVTTYSLTYEQELLKRNKQFFEPMDIQDDWSLKSCRASVNRIVTSLVANIPDDEERVQHLAHWLYMVRKPGVSTPPELPPVSYHHEKQPTAQGASQHDFSLIGRDILLALLVWEHLVFDRRWQLKCGQCQNNPPCNKCQNLREMVWRLREPKFTGSEATTMNLDNQNKAKGSTGRVRPFEGLREAAAEVHGILTRQPPTSSPIDLTLDGFTPGLPRESIVKEVPTTSGLVEYAGKLWEKCWEVYPSTFGALYLWTTVWYIDIGNRGFHTTPLLPYPEDTFNLWLDYIPRYLTSWRIRWRFIWQRSILCQLIIMLPTLISVFITLVI